MRSKTFARLLCALAATAAVVVQRAEAQSPAICPDEYTACDEDPDCSGCFNWYGVADSRGTLETYFAEYSDCATYFIPLTSGDTCLSVTAGVCCSNGAGYNDCLANERFDAYWACWIEDQYGDYGCTFDPSICYDYRGDGDTAAALAEVSTVVTATANAWDARTDGDGCSPSGCVASNAVDASIEAESRWSCNAKESGVYACELTMVLDEPQDIVEMRIALWKGDTRTRTMKVWVDGEHVDTITSSGTTEDYEPYELTATQATTIMLQSSRRERRDWLSVTGVKFMVDTELEVSPPSPAPMSDDYLGCFNDMVGDRVLTSVRTDEALTPEACASACAETNTNFYGLQQGNECWCAGCDLTNADYNRHGEGICDIACAGDSSSACGGGIAFSLYQTASC